MFKDHLFIVENQNIRDGCAEFSIRLNSGHKIFHGHFPGDKIFPGVCIFQIATELFNMVHPIDAPMFSVKNAKFLHLIRPDLQPVVNYTLTWTSSAEGCDIKTSVDSDDTLLAKIFFKAYSQR